MEAAKKDSSKAVFMTSVSLAIVALIAASAALSLCVYYDSRLTALEIKQHNIEKLILLATKQVSNFQIMFIKIV